jgi:hypothetical protein
LVGQGGTKFKENNLDPGGCAMKRKKLTHGITFFVTAETYQAVREDVDECQISISELMRGLIEDYLNGTHFYSRPSFEEREIDKTSNEEAEPNE